MSWRALILVLALTTSAQAGQPATANNTGANLPPAVVVLVDMERIFRDSAVAKDIRLQIEAERDKMRAAIEARQKALKDSEAALLAEKGKLDPKEYDRRVRAYEDEVRAVRRQAQDDGARLQQALARANAELREALAPILRAVMVERGANIMADITITLFSDQGLNVTDAVLRRIDAAAPKVKVVIPQKSE